MIYPVNDNEVSFSTIKLPIETPTYMFEFEIPIPVKQTH